jgi:hypothetical protein
VRELAVLRRVGIVSGIIGLVLFSASACEPAPPPAASPPGRVELTVTLDRDVTTGASSTAVMLRGPAGCDIRVIKDELLWRQPATQRWDDTQVPSTPWVLLAGSRLVVTVPNREVCWKGDPNVITSYQGKVFTGPSYFLDVPVDDGFAYRNPPTGDPWEVNPWQHADSGSRVTTVPFYDGLTIVK